MKLNNAEINGQPQSMHNYYAPERFFDRRDAARLRTVHAERVMLVPEDFLMGFQLALDEQVGDAAGEIMYRCGFEWGKQDIVLFMKRLEAEYQRPTKTFSMGTLLELWWWPLQAEGWGAWRYDLSNRKEGLVYIDVFESAVAQTIGNIGKVVCHYYAGMFAAVFSHLSRKDLSGIEIQCLSMGEDFCKFLIGSSKRINAAQFWVREGAAAKDIIARL
jgi:uncharacterized protein